MLLQSGWHTDSLLEPRLPCQGTSILHLPQAITCSMPPPRPTVDAGPTTATFPGYVWPFPKWMS